MEKITTVNFRATQQAGAAFSKKLRAGEIVLLSGELGAGKTTFVQGLAGELGVKDRIISPTFMLVRKHKVRSKIPARLASESVAGRKDLRSKIKTVYHIDLYRLEGELDVRGLGLDDIFADENSVFLIEWGEKHEGLKPDWEVRLEVAGENTRMISISKFDNGL